MDFDLNATEKQFLLKTYRFSIPSIFLGYFKLLDNFFLNRESIKVKW